MSDNNIPFEIQLEIIQRIPDTKSVIRCRSLSKAWRSEIDSKEFVTAHTLRHHQAHNRHHLLIRTKDCSDCKDCTCVSGYYPKDCNQCNYTPVKYVSIVDDDDIFPHQKVSVFVPDSVRKFSDGFVIILSGSHGLFCLYKYETDTAIIWNPSIRKTVSIPVPKEPKYFTVGFGVCPQNLDPKLVKITYVYKSGVFTITQVEVFTLSSGGTCRSPLSSNLPHKLILYGDSQAVVDGFIYWDAAVGYRNLIISFDLTREEFTKVNLPDSLALNNPCAPLPLYNLRESLAVLESEFNRVFNRIFYHVWQMIGHGCTRSFNKLYSICAPDTFIHRRLAFRRSGEPIIEVDNDKEVYYKYERALAIYEAESKTITNIGIYGLGGTFIVHSYMETLLLHGHLDIEQR